MIVSRRAPTTTILPLATAVATTALFGAAILFAGLLPLAHAAPQGTSGSNGGKATTDDPNARLPHGSSSVFLSAAANDDDNEDGGGGGGGGLGSVPPGTLTLIEQDPDEVKDAAGEALHAILQERLGFTGQEEILPIESQPIRVDKQQRAHIRYRQHVDGLPLEGATLSLHFDVGTGQVLAANGEFHSMDSIVGNNRTDRGSLDCSVATELALIEHLAQLSVANPADVGGEWMDDCQPAAVQGRDGKPYLAYKRMYGFQPETKQTFSADPNGTSNATLLVESEPPRLDVLFADRVTGQLVAVHPKVTGARTMTTYDCNSVAEKIPWDCTVATNSSGKIGTGDPVLDSAHNHTVDVYDFYAQHFGRKGIDGKERKVQTLTHYGLRYNNAFFTPSFGGVFAYGDGDGSKYSYWAQFDVVAHEFSHGVTAFTSDLVYSFESGALNEAFSDVMAATADRLVKGKAPVDVWRVAEDVDLLNGVGIRNMADPTEFNDPDHYANRTLASEDGGGVHTNSGIMNKAFYLMVAGGTHPLSGIVVPPLSTNFDTSIKQAATLFYNANTMCLTESSDYFSMRECTLLFASAAQKPTVQKAWDAVGVKAHLPLTPNVRRTGLSLPYDHDVQVFVLDRTLFRGDTVACRLTGTNGDPDLSVRFGRAPNLVPNYRVDNDCWSATDGTIEECETGEAPAPFTKVYVAVESFEAAANMELLCTINGDGRSTTLAPTTGAPTRSPTRAPARSPTRAPTRTPAPVPPPPPTCKPLGARCASRTQCCQAPSAAACDGPRASSKVCKACKARRAPCTRSSQCCAGLRCSGRRCVKREGGGRGAT